MAEHLLCKEGVRSSSLLVSTTLGKASGGRDPAHGRTTQELKSSGLTPDDPRVPGDVSRRFDGLVLEPSSRVRAPGLGPLIRVLHRRPPTSGSLETRPVSRHPSRPRQGSHLNNWIVFGSKSKSSISPSFKDQSRSHSALAAWSDAGGGQATKGTRWMPWRQEPMKDVAGCEKLRGVASRRYIRRCPNGETRLGSCPVTLG